MIEPNDTLFPFLDAAMASYTGIENEAVFRGWLKNGISTNCDIGRHIQTMLNDDSVWPVVYRLVTMKTKKLCLQSLGDLIEITHGVEGDYSYGSGPAVVTVSIGSKMRDLLVTVGVLAQIVEFIENSGRKVQQDKTGGENDGGTLQPDGKLDSGSEAHANAEKLDALDAALVNHADAEKTADHEKPDDAANDETPENDNVAETPVELDATPVTPDAELNTTPEPAPKPKKTRKKKTDVEPSGESGTPVVANAETDGGESGDVPTA